jgi:hypothetical protein
MVDISDLCNDVRYVDPQKHFDTARMSSDINLRAIGLLAKHVCDNDPVKLADFMRIEEHGVWGWIVDLYDIDPSRVNLAIEKLRHIDDQDVIAFILEFDIEDTIQSITVDDALCNELRKLVYGGDISLTILDGLKRCSVHGLPSVVIARYYAALTIRYVDGSLDDNSYAEVLWRRKCLVSLLCGHMKDI